ncbi:hypothetical protein GUJ93_ZPchr0007g4066 [Zizania palustris]|uniref:Secreted protein n=1 Tax=Zizania palustris TaxID=103762 RepID=A0A8J5STE8_ZIZPA|nr:hypothetical protein GUJ93_ZPchr0007g4066 [Zizania palustris]
MQTAKTFDFFYLVQQVVACWVVLYFCDTQKGCCFPDTGKPAADFGTHGLWLNYGKCRSGRDELTSEEGSFDMAIVGRRQVRTEKCWPEYWRTATTATPARLSFSRCTSASTAPGRSSSTVKPLAHVLGPGGRRPPSSPTNWPAGQLPVRWFSKQFLTAEC